MRTNFLIALVAGLLLAMSLLAYDWFAAIPPETASNPQYVGRATCAECHATEHALWLGSDHDRAMELATDESVLADFDDASFTYQGVTSRFFRRDGKFFVNTEGPDGEFRDYEIKYTFGVRPLQQYMVEFPDGRVQVLRESWDVEKKEWFYVNPPDVIDERIEPGDPLHWTGIAQNWNTTCADCHSTDVHKGYDSASDTYHTTFEEIDVSCEECHGPGSVHVELARSWSPFWDRRVGYGLPSLKNKNVDTQLEVCAKCHARRHQIHESFRPGKPFMNHYEPSLLAEGLYAADGQILDEVYEYASFLQSKMYANRVQCSDCHDPHSLNLKFQGNQLCAQCHEPAKYDTPGHHHHPVNSAGAQCIECHMPLRTYMVIDDRRDHSFRVPRPDLSVELGTPNACNDCHTAPHETFEWAADAVDKWYGTERAGDPHWAHAFAAARAGKPEAEPLLLELVSRRSTPAIIRATAIDHLAAYDSADSASARRDALRDRNPLVRTAAVRALPFESPAQYANDLADLLDDPIRSVRLASVTNLLNIPLDQLPDQKRADFDRALAEFRATQQLSLDHAGGHFALAGLDRRFGRIEEAIDHLREAIRLEPYMAGPRTELASILQELGRNADEVRRLREEEIQLMQRDVQLAPEAAHIWYQLGLLQYLLERYDDAENSLHTAHELAPHDYRLLMALALLHERRYELTGDQQQFENAVAALRQLHELNRADPSAEQILRRLMELRQARESQDAP